MTSQNVELDIVVGTDHKPVRQLGHEGKTFIEAREGVEYALRFKNSNPFRVLVVPSVDGLSALSGSPASKSDGGYIVAAYSSLLVQGFRKSLDEVGAFKFCKKESGYATEKGGGANVGVISVAVFKEKPAPVPQWKEIIRETHIHHYPKWPKYWHDDDWYRWGGTTYPTWTCGDTTHATYSCSNNAGPTKSGGSFDGGTLRAMAMNAAPVPSSVEAEPETFAAATQWGKKLDDKVQTAEFVREESQFAELTIYYDFKDGLERMGIVIKPEKSVVLPQAFPRDFASPPKGWTG